MPADPTSLGDFELLLLLTVLRLGDQAYGVPLCRELSAIRRRGVAVGSVYAALDRLQQKGLVSSTLGESTPERGGRAKRFFRLTQAGLRSVHHTRRLLDTLWTALPPLAEEPA